MRIILVVLAILPLAAMWYDIYQKREQRVLEEAFLTVAEPLVVERLKAPAGQDIADPIVLSPADDQSWSLRGKLMLAEEGQEIERRRIAAGFERVCEEAERQECWRLVSLAVDGEQRPLGEQSAAAPVASEAEAAPEPAAAAVSEPMVPDPSPTQTAPDPPASAAPDEAREQALIVGGGVGSDSLPLPAAASAAAVPPPQPPSSDGQPTSISIPLAASEDPPPAEQTTAEQTTAEQPLPLELPSPVPLGDAAAEPAEPGSAASPAGETEQAAVPPAATGAPQPATAEPEELPVPAAPERSLVTNVQSALNALGYGQPRPLSVDGVAGPQTRQAILAYREQNALSGGDEVTPELLAHMATQIEQRSSTQAEPTTEGTTSPEPPAQTGATAATAPAAEPAQQAAEQDAAPPASEQAAPEVDESLVYLIQDRLLRLGYGGGLPLARDGKLSERTVSLIASYQQEHALTVDGRPSESLLRHMESTMRQKSQSSSAGTAQ